LAPGFVAHSPLRNAFASYFLRDLQGTVTVDSASLRWWGPIVLREIEVRDPLGKVLLVIPRLESRKTLLELLRDSSDWGSWHGLQPSLHLVCSGPETNLEQVFAHWLKRDHLDTGLEGTALGLDLENARITIHDDATHQHWTLDPINFSLNLPRSRSTPVRLRLQAVVGESPSRGRVEAELTMQRQTSTGCLTVRLDALPIGLVQPLLRRQESLVQIDGRVSGQLKYHWDGNEATHREQKLDGQLSGKNLVVRGPWPNGDPLRLGHVEAPIHLAVQGSQLRIAPSEVQCDLGKLALACTWDLSRPGLSGLAHSLYEVAADLDLARLAPMLPPTFPFRPATQIRAGRLHLACACRPGPGGLVWQGTLQTSDLQAVNPGQPLVVLQPIAAVVQAHQAGPDSIMVDHCRAEAGFLTLEASGALDGLTATVQYDLGQLSNQLAQLVDLGSFRMTGQGTTQVAVQWKPDGQVLIQGEGQLRQFQLAGLTRPTLPAQPLTVRLNLAGQTAGGSPRLNSAQCRLESGSEVIECQLLEPLTRFRHGPWGPVQLHVQGDLTAWRQRLQPWLRVPEGWQVAGTGDLTAQLRATTETVTFDALSLGLRALACRSADFQWSEPRLDLATTGAWQLADCRLELRETRLAAAAVEFQAPQLQIWFPRQGTIELNGRILVQGDLARFPPVVRSSIFSVPEPLTGKFAGAVDWRQAGGRVQAGLDLTLQDLAIGPSPAPAWREAEVRVRGKGHCDPAAELIQIDQLQVDGSAIGCEAQGRIARLNSSRDLRLTGQLRYDLDKLSALLRPSLGDHVSATGQEVRPFRLEGSLAARGPSGQPSLVIGQPPPSLLGSLSAKTTVAWKSVAIGGLQAGPAEVQARLLDGWLRVQPIETTLGGGRLRLEPSVRLEPGPVAIHLAPGKVLDQVRITPAAGSNLLAYVAPMLAGATVDGQVSLALEDSRLPLQALATAQLGGRLTIHSARISASPLLRELGLLRKRPPTADLVREAVVSFQVANGRVYHRDLELVFPDLTIRTSGSVGFDGSLDLVAEMPVPSKLLGHGRLADAAARQPLRLPIRGTLEKPKLVVRQASLDGFVVPPSGGRP
jgi:hypothetical protein